MVGYSGTLGIGYAEDHMTMKRQIGRWKGIASRFKVKLVKMVKGVNGRFHDYAISPVFT